MNWRSGSRAVPKPRRIHRARIHDASLDAIVMLADGDLAELTRLVDGPNFDFESFKGFIIDHNLCNLAFPFLDIPSLRDRSPESFAKRLEKQRTRQSRKQDILWNALLTVDQRLRAERVDYMLLKGFAYSSQFFSNANRRHQNDLDLLVRPSQCLKTVRILESLGFEADTMVSQDRVSVDFEIEMRSRDTTVDLHMMLRNRPGYQIDYDSVWRRRRQMQADELQFSTLSDEYSIVLLLLSIAEDVGRGACRLKHFVDLYCLIRSVGNRFGWLEFFENRRRENVETICVNVLEMLCHLFQANRSLDALAAALGSSRCRRRTNRDHTFRLLHNPRPSVQNKLWLFRRTPAALMERVRMMLIQPARIPETVTRKMDQLRVSLLSPSKS